MMWLRCALILAWLVVLPAHAVNKCTMPDGRIVYSDAPCATSAKQAQTLSAEPAVPPIPARPTRPLGPQPGSSVPADTVALQIPPPRRTVEFSGMPESDLSLAAAAMSKIRVLGRDCEWALQVDKTKMQACVEFLSRMQPKGEYDQITARVSQVLTYEPNAARAAAADLRKLNLHRDEALRYKATAMAKLGSTSR